MTRRSVKRSTTLIEKAKELSGKYKKKRQCWYDEYCRSHPKEAKELKEFAEDWLNSGDSRQALPKLVMLHRFCVENCEGLSEVRYQAFRTWMGTLGGQ